MLCGSWKIIYNMAEWSKFDLSFDCFDFPKDDSWLCEPNKPTFDCFDFPKDDPWLCEPNKPTFEINKPTFDCFDFPKDDPWLCEPNKPTFEINKPTFDCNKPTFEITDDIPWLDDLNLYAKSLGNTSSKKCEHTVTSKDFEQSAISEDLEQSTTSEDIVQSTTSKDSEQSAISKDSEQSAISEDFEQSTTTSEDFEQSTTTSKDFVQSTASKDFEQSATSKDQKQHQNEKPKVIVEKIEVDISSIEILRNGYDRGVRVKPSMDKYSLHKSSKRKFGTDCQSIESEKEQYNLRKKSTMINEERPPDCKSRNSRTETGMKLKDFPMMGMRFAVIMISSKWVFSVLVTICKIMPGP
ncbi:uncharacterized protein LOC118186989 [Stegodyphus dumicola]|uniref:uncharacterized protein LOC118186989 n=1 Tax=Stegodyphus dumicola TaxID=202533 RepID=UPI0015B308B7|nr:uncharacterized protein LOC118186989 [Stegodyphus dumicola]